MRTYQIFIAALAVAFFISCAKVPITGRKQTNLVAESELISMSLTEYSSFLSQSQVVTPPNGDAAMVKRVGDRIANSVIKYMKDHGKSKRLEGFAWEFNLINEDVANAWCMPGGKVAVYTGILPITQDESGLSVVMGHEIAHAIARHGNERMSQGLIAQLGLGVLSIAMSENPTVTKDIFMQSVGIGTQLGILSFSRKHESEADHMGLVFMAMAGYNPQEAPKFWERMAAMSGGAAPPEFLSTHPSHETRVADINSHMQEAMKYYTPR